MSRPLKPSADAVRQLRIKLQLLALKMEQEEQSGFISVANSVELTNLSRDMNDYVKVRQGW